MALVNQDSDYFPCEKCATIQFAAPVDTTYLKTTTFGSRSIEELAKLHIVDTGLGSCTFLY
jgi:hypothetical protein